MTGSSHLLIELFYIGMPVVRTDGRAGDRSVGRSEYGIVITKFSRMGSLPKRQVLTFSLGSSPVRVDTVEATSQRSKEKFLLKTLVYTLTC